ncbi:hydrogen peroxide-inducible genes activator [soil metagenome]
MIDRYLIRYFTAVVSEGNFSKAAALCQVSQPTLSVGIAKLERLVGAALFLRSNRRVELTPAGVRFNAVSRRIEAAFAEAESFGDLSAPRPLIRLAVLSTLPAQWIGEALAAVRRAGLSERLEIVEGRQRDLGALLERGRADAALGVIDGDPRGRQALFDEPYTLAVAADHPLAERAVVEAQELADATMIVRRNCEVLSDTSRYFTARGVRPFMAARTTNDERAMAYVRAGLGATVAPRCFGGEGIATPLLAGFTASRTLGFLIDADSARRLEKTRSLGLFGEALAARHQLAA